MRASCLQENLSKGLAIVGRAVAARPTLPVLSNVLLSTDGAQLKLAATDLELFIVCWIGARVEQDGQITLPARLFTELINSFPPERVDMSLDEQTLHLTCARNQADIKGIDAQEFPLIPRTDGLDDAPWGELLIEPDLLRQMIAQVVFAVATDEGRPILTGALARFDGDTLTFAAADGFRLSVCTARLSRPVAQPIGVVIPAKALNELARISSEEQAPIGMYVTPSRSQVLFHLQGNAGSNEGKIFGIDLVSQLIEGNFPDFKQIIPKSYATRTVLNTAEFLKACKTANIFARSGGGDVVQLDINPSSGKLIISAKSSETGDSEVELDAAIEGQPLQIAFNVRFLIEALSVMNSAQVSLETNTPATPGVLKPMDGSDFVHVVMPMHTRR